MANDVMAALQEAMRQQQAGQTALAEAGYRRVLERDPNQPQALLLLGVLRHQAGRPQEAVELIGRAAALDPNSPQMHLNYGFALKACGRLDEAAAEYAQAIRLKGDYAAAHFNLAVLLEETRRPDDAVAAYQRAIAAKRDYIDAHNNLCHLLLSRGRFEEALDIARRAVQLRPDLLRVRTCLGAAYTALQRFDEAEACFGESERLRDSAPAPDHTAFDVERGVCLFLHGRAQEGLAILDEVVRTDATNADARFYRGTMLLALGQYAQGWKDYGERWNTKTFRGTMRTFAERKWDGSPLAGRTILLWAEQGIGDTIQFIRYAPLLASQGARVIIECQRELAGLLRTVEGIMQVTARGEPLPPFDVHAPLMDLPALLGTTLETIPQTVPYLHPSAAMIEKWAARIGHAPGERNVALAWAGGPTHRRDRWRSIPFAKMMPLLTIPRIRWFSLQKGPASAALKEAPGSIVTDLDAELRDFADTAAAISAMDLLISVDTAIAHLAGALAKPTWVLLPEPADFRWMIGCQDTPWYPTMRLFRQPRPGNWDQAIGRVADALSNI